jgi:hypothetical protein
MNDSPANTEEIAELLVYLGGHADRCRIRPDGGAMDSHAVFSRANRLTPSAFASFTPTTRALHRKSSNL